MPSRVNRFLFIWNLITVTVQLVCNQGKLPTIVIMLLHCLSANHVRKMHGLVTFGRLKCISGCMSQRLQLTCTSSDSSLLQCIHVLDIIIGRLKESKALMSTMVGSNLFVYCMVSQVSNCNLDSLRCVTTLNPLITNIAVTITQCW